MTPKKKTVCTFRAKTNNLLERVCFGLRLSQDKHSVFAQHITLMITAAPCLSHRVLRGYACMLCQSSNDLVATQVEPSPVYFTTGKKRYRIAWYTISIHEIM